MKLTFLKALNFFSLKNQKNLQFNNYIYKIIGVKPRNLQLYRLAFIHSSSNSKIGYNNERLEFLGDSVLQTILSSNLFKLYPNEGEGVLTKIRGEIVSRKTLNKIANELRIDSFLETDKGLQISNLKYVPGNTLEALIGAIFLDFGYVKCQQIVLNKIIAPFLNISELKTDNFNPKSKLLEWTQKNQKNIEFNIINEYGKANNKEFEVEIKIENIKYGVGKGHTKKSAEQNASQSTLSILNIIPEN